MNGLRGLSACASCKCQGGGVNGLRGFAGLGTVDVSAISVQAALEALKRLPEGDMLAVIKGLPESVVRKICEEGVKDEITAYLPMAAGIGAGLLLLWILMK
jgi:hypothetical protein